ncbi:MAG: DNA methyltransferase [Phycisphaerales bacterium]|nr:DNA methylase [Planctomycetota bacterium]
MRLQTTTLWEYPSQHYQGATGAMQGDKRYIGASPSWVIWQCLQRYTRPGDIVLDPMVGSGTTIDVANDLGRRAIGIDLQPSRPDIRQGDARRIDLPNAGVDFVFIDPPYSTHIDYSDNPACIGKLDALGPDAGRAYYDSMRQVIREISRVLKPAKHMALYVSDSYSKPGPNSRSTGFAPIGFELFAMMRERFLPVDIIAVVRQNQKLRQGNWHKAAEEGNFFLRGFNYLFIMRKA